MKRQDKATTAFQGLPHELAELLNWGAPMDARHYIALREAWNWLTENGTRLPPKEI